MSRRRVLTAELRSGMVISSQRTSYYVYSFGTDLDACRSFPMKGRAIVLKELTWIKLKKKKDRFDPSRRIIVTRDAFVKRNMLLLSHYKHGIVMYFSRRSNDDKWFLIEEKKKKDGEEIGAGHSGRAGEDSGTPQEGGDPPEGEGKRVPEEGLLRC